MSHPACARARTQVCDALRRSCAGHPHGAPFASQFGGSSWDGGACNLALYELHVNRVAILHIQIRRRLVFVDTFAVKHETDVVPIDTLTLTDSVHQPREWGGSQARKEYYLAIPHFRLKVQAAGARSRSSAYLHVDYIAVLDVELCRGLFRVYLDVVKEKVKVAPLARGALTEEVHRPFELGRRLQREKDVATSPLKLEGDLFHLPPAVRALALLLVLVPNGVLR